MKKFFKKIVNKVKEVFRMAVKAVKDGLEVNSETINTLGTSFFEYLENKDNIKAAEKEKVVDVVEDTLKGTVNFGKEAVNAINNNPLGYAVDVAFACLGVSVAFGLFCLGTNLKNKLA